MNANFGLLDPLRRARSRRSGRRSCWSSGRRRISDVDGSMRDDAVRRAVGRGLSSPVTEPCRRHLRYEVPSSSPTSRRSGTSRRTRSRPIGRDLEAFTEFCDRHYGGAWSWATVDRLGLRGFLGELQRRGLAKRSAARALSAVRSFYRYLQVHHGMRQRVARAAKVAEAREAAADLSATGADRAALRAAAEAAAGAATSSRYPRPRDARAVLLDRAPALGAGGLEPRGSRPARPTRSRCAARDGRSGSCPVGSRAVLALRRYLHAPGGGGRAGPAADRRAVFVSRRGRRLAPRSDSAVGCTACSTRSAATACGSTRSGTPSPPTCWTPAPTCARCRSCWATPRSAPRRSTRTPAWSD